MTELETKQSLLIEVLENMGIDSSILLSSLDSLRDLNNVRQKLNKEIKTLKGE